MKESDTDWVESSLKEFERRARISKVLSTDAEAAVSKGDNYSADISRLKVKVVLKSGETEERWVIYKALPKTVFRRKVLLQSGVFEKEAKMYLDVLPEMEYIRQRKDPLGEPLSPECYGVRRRNDGFLLEDLKRSCFEMGNRRKGLDFDHCVLALKGLAQFHALAAVIQENGTFRLKDFSLHYFENKFERLDQFYKHNLNDLVYLLEEVWKGEWSVYAEKVKSLSEIIASKVSEHFKVDENNFNTLNHGDFWVNNVMFKRGRGGEPKSLRVIDFQGCHYNSPGYDLQYFLQTSPDLKNRKRKDELLKIYYDLLVRHLELFGYPGKLPTLDELKLQYKEAAYFGLGVGLITMPLMMFPPEQAMDLEVFARSLDEREAGPLGLYVNEGGDFVEALKLVLVEAEEHGLL